MKCDRAPAFALRSRSDLKEDARASGSLAPAQVFIPNSGGSVALSGSVARGDRSVNKPYETSASLYAVLLDRRRSDYGQLL